jgi:hypothetical protein
MSTVYNASVRKALGYSMITSETRITDADLFVSTGFCSFGTLLRLARLRYWGRLLKKAPFFLMQMLLKNEPRKGSWMTLLSTDCVWLHTVFPKVRSKLPFPAAGDFEAWAVCASSTYWQTLLKGCKESLQDGSTVDCDDLLVRLVPPPGELVACDHCGLMFPSGNGLRLHLNKMHGRRAEYSKYAHSSAKCGFCLKSYHCRIRLKNHLRDGIRTYANMSCAAQLHLCNGDALSLEHCTLLDKADSEFIRSARRSGLPNTRSQKPVQRGIGPARPKLQGEVPFELRSLLVRPHGIGS